MFFDNGKYFVFDKVLTSSKGHKINVFKLDKELLDDNSLNQWASSIRNNYVEENLLDSLISETGLTKKEYLEKIIFPDPTNSQGAATMSGEFGELLVYDYIDFVLNYYVPRTRYFEKVNRNMPIPGSDVMGYKVNNINKPNRDDRLLVAEIKTRSSISRNKDELFEKTLKAAIKDSSDENKRIRLGESLNAEKRRLLNRSRIKEAEIVGRFQNKTDYPFALDFFAVAVLDNELYSDQVVLNVVNSQHEKVKSTNVLIIHSKELKLFLRDLYRRACLC